jgi:hypothetical protein
MFFKHLFWQLTILYVLLLLVESILPGFVSNSFNSQLLAYPILVLGVIFLLKIPQTSHSLVDLKLSLILIFALAILIFFKINPKITPPPTISFTPNPNLIIKVSSTAVAQQLSDSGYTKIIIVPNKKPKSISTIYFSPEDEVQASLIKDILDPDFAPIEMAPPLNSEVGVITIEL